ncbi:IS66 family insertion sequence element accessory protein TnpA [Anaeromyxobacter soli]|uniref:IS66 family insertion sequence element accessory protein TnpA n=1 Tax=Anaeromyxobacter soli TaxID=2922725 RepID=UPI0038CC15F1
MGRADGHRARVARGWAASGLTQDAYAKQHGISARTLRAWRRRHSARQPGGTADIPADSVEGLRASIQNAIDQLRGILDRLPPGRPPPPSAPPAAYVSTAAEPSDVCGAVPQDLLQAAATARLHEGAPEGYADVSQVRLHAAAAAPAPDIIGDVDDWERRLSAAGGPRKSGSYFSDL